MLQLPEALAPLGAFKQFCLYKLVPSQSRPGKTDKYPCNISGQVVNAHDPSIWLDAPLALNTAAMFGPQYGVAFVFTAADPFFFLDIDDCKGETTWSPVAMELIRLLPGAAIEVSQSGKGLHVFGRYSGTAPAHGCKNVPLGLELYTELRFVALTGLNAIGDAGLDCTANLAGVVAAYFPPGAGGGTGSDPDDWTTEPVPEYTGPEDDDELIRRACAVKSAESAFTGSSSFAALWAGDEEALAISYPETGDKCRPYDESSADGALAAHLAFWTGKNCERMLRLMERSGLVRDKWADREDYYLNRTILRACAFQGAVYSIVPVDTTIADELGAVTLKGSKKQQDFAAGIRAQKLIDCAGESDLIDALLSNHGPTATCKFWIENKDATPEELAEIAKPVGQGANPLGDLTGPELATGYQFLPASGQIEHFKGCVYVQDMHRVFTPTGSLLKSEQFNATYGGYCFQLDADGSGKVTRKAWEAFTESQAVRYPKAESMCFRPELPSGALVEQDGRVLVNTYVPIDTPRQQGDPGPFLKHLAKVLPAEQDRSILLAYMAACVQYKGVKFQWAPLLQGVEGNGKTLFTRCVAAAIGDRYVHMPPADQISEKYNSWLFNMLFVGVEDIYVPDHKREVIEIIKPMITNDRLARRAMQTDQIMQDVRCNFIFNSNHRDAVRKTQNDRRFAIFYTAQQLPSDIPRDGMAGDYFPKLYTWLRSGGYAIVTDFLYAYTIPDALNPATDCHRSPETTSTGEAIVAGLGGIEQEILEAIDEERIGFCGGWVSSMALERLLQGMHRAGALPHNKRRELLQALGYEWHPALKEGRVNNVVTCDGGKPRLFIKNGHISANLTTAGEAVKAYETAQGPTGATSPAARAFTGGGN